MRCFRRPQSAVSTTRVRKRDIDRQTDRERDGVMRFDVIIIIGYDMKECYICESS